MKKTFSLQQQLVHVMSALTLFKFATGLVGVFIPLVILQSGGDLKLVAAFYVIYAVAKLLLNFPLTLLIQKHGAHFGLGAGFLTAGLQLAGVLGYASTHSVLYLVMGAIGLAVSNAFVWNSMHVHVSQVMDDVTKSSNLAKIEIIGLMTEVATPLIGGFVAALFGEQVLLALAMLCVLLTFIPLAGVGKLHQRSNTVLRYNLSGAPLRDVVANFSWNIDSAIGTMLWPIYLAVVLGTYKSVGGVAALAAFAAIVMTWIAGKQGDTGQSRGVLLRGTAGNSFMNLMRLFATTPLTITATSFLYRASIAYQFNAWTSTYYHHAKKRGLQYIISMEIACDLAYLVLWGGLFLVLSVANNSNLFFTTAFILAAVAAWGALLISKQKPLAKEGYSGL